MTYEEKKQWLRLYRKAERWERIKLEEVEQQRTAATRVTQVLSSIPGGTGDGQALARAVERIEAAQMEAAQAAEQCAAVMALKIPEEASKSTVLHCFAPIRRGTM